MERPQIKSYKDLEVWQVAMSLAEASYRVTAKFPKAELFGLTSQIRRSATSIAANIAEGHGRETTATFVQFLRISQGSLKELETHFLISLRVTLIEAKTAEKLLALCESVGRMLRALIRSLQAK